MYEWKGYRIGALLGTQYYFPKQGDGIPMHDHRLEDQHNVIVLKGSCLAYGPNKSWCYHLGPGSVLHFQEHEQLHEIVALENHTTILNLALFADRFSHLKYWAQHDEFGVYEGSVTIPLSKEDLQMIENEL